MSKRKKDTRWPPVATIELGKSFSPTDFKVGEKFDFHLKGRLDRIEISNYGIRVSLELSNVYLVK